MTGEYALFLTSLNLLISVFVISSCACRLAQLPPIQFFPLPPPKSLLSRVVFVAILASAFCNGFRGPLFGTAVPNWWPIIGGLSIALLLLEGFFGWRREVDGVEEDSNEEEESSS